MQILAKKACLMFVIAFCTICKSNAQSTADTFKFITRISNGAYDISLSKLLATPDKYHGKIVKVSGYLNLEFEGDAIYLYRDDFTYSRYKNAFSVSFNREQPVMEASVLYSGKYVTIVGRFNMDDLGHMMLFSGTIEDIRSIEIMKKR